ncbi:hypothetical protein BRARA_H01682 [Brassica rapa]|uniref:Uncharacterized protein n=1 Tax=Brassica campestris TaxID=3711 RepID=A0A397YDN3_BRACM|nr:hypothetical protein BRARA_H01682 [Brassica rapa]
MACSVAAVDTFISFLTTVFKHSPSPPQISDLPSFVNAKLSSSFKYFSITETLAVVGSVNSFVRSLMSFSRIRLTFTRLSELIAIKQDSIALIKLESESLYPLKKRRRWSQKKIIDRVFLLVLIGPQMDRVI